MFRTVWRNILDLPRSAKLTLLVSAFVIQQYHGPSSSSSMSSTRIPSVYIPHGGGPLPILGDPDHAKMVDWLNGFTKKYLTSSDKTPNACLVVSAHWEEPQATVQSGDTSTLYYDYYGFPKKSYDLKYPLPGNKELSKRVQGLLEGKGIKYKVDKERGFDHGVFIPLMLLYPEANIPTIQISLIKGLDPAEHIRLGEALAPLRDEGVLILGSGMSYHNMRGFGDPKANEASIPFHDYLRQIFTQDSSYDEKKKALISWKSAPKGKECHPREEHLIPLMVIFGTSKDASGGVGREEFYEDVIQVKCAGYVFD